MPVIGQADLVIEFLEKRSANSADRTSNTVFDLSGQDLNPVFMPYGPQWRRHRRSFWQHFHPGAAAKYRPLQRAKTYAFLVGLFRSPLKLEKHLRNMVTVTMLQVIYGVNVTREDDERIQIMDAAMESVRLSTPGGFTVEMVPWLRYVPGWFPGAGFQKIFATCKVANDHLRHTLFDGAKQSISEQADAILCVVSGMLARALKEPVAENGALEEENTFKNVCAIALEAGPDTTFSALQAFSVAMALHPRVQKKAQAELDRVVGPDRLPEFSDSDALVYVNALLKELLQWHVVNPLGVAHRTIKDDEFRGFFVPAGTNVFANVWEIMHGPETFDNPNEFHPERYVRNEDSDAQPVPDLTLLAFGFGRR
ncbi:cytochrome P450 [Trametes meyenii]|nr:cytochrome P450 [Trametes meyenii]